jgi:hypothetical protein
MPVATTAIIAGGTALAGMGMNIGQAVKANKQAKAAGQAATAAAQQLKGIKEQNMFAQVQVPTLGFEMAQQGIDRSTQAALGAVQGAGAEGVIGGVGQIMGATSEAEMGLAAQASEAKMQRDMAQAQAGAEIEGRRGIREAKIYGDELEGAQLAKSAAETAKTEAISGAVGSLGGAVGSFGGLIGAGYGKSAPAGTTIGTNKQGQETSYAPGYDKNGKIDPNKWMNSIPNPFQ